ncbi:hypothetical protein JCM8202v2_002447 [Rhodotorula sphaerocarpa]
MARASPFLLSLGVSKSMMSVVFLAGPLSGLIVQPLVGVLSDRCKSRFGRRRPFIVLGCVLSSLSVLMLGWSREIAAIFSSRGSSLHDHLAIACAVLAVYVVDFSVNVIQAMDRSLLVDVTPPAQQPAANAWAGRMFGFGAVFGYWLGGIDLVWWTRGMLGDEQLKASLAVLTFFTSFFLCATHAITCCCVEERVLISRDDEDGKEDAGGPLQAVGEIWRTIKTLPTPIRQVFHVQFTGWIGWFPILFFSTTWVAEIYVKNRNPGTDLADASEALAEAATKAGTNAMLWHSVVSLATSIVIPPLIRTEENEDKGPAGSAGRGHLRSATSAEGVLGAVVRGVDLARRVLPRIPFEWLTLPLLWTVSNAFFAVLLVVGTWTAKSVAGASFVIAAAGFCWAVTNWAPFALLGELILRLDGDSGSSAALDDLHHRSSTSTLRLHETSSRQHLPLDDHDEHHHDEAVTAPAPSLLPPFQDDFEGNRSKRSLSGSPGPNRADPPAHLDLTPRARPVESMDQSQSASLSAEVPGALRSRSDTVETMSSFGSPTTARSAYFDATSSVEGDARSIASSGRSGEETPDDGGGSSTGSHTPRLGGGDGFAPSTPPKGGGDANGRRRKRDSIVSTASDQSTIAYPPNHGTIGVDLFEAAARGSGPGLGAHPGGPGEWYGSDPYAYHSSSTVHLPNLNAGLSPPRLEYGGRPRSPPGGKKGGLSPELKQGGAGSHIIRVATPSRRSGEMDGSRPSTGRRYDLEEGDSEEDDLVVHDQHRLGLGSARHSTSFDDPYRERSYTGLTPRIVVAGEDDESLRNWEPDLQTNSPGGDQTGVILGCHNIFLVLPQFLVSGVSSVIFALLAPHHSVLGHAATTAPASGAPPPPSNAAIAAEALGDLGERGLVVRGLAAFGRAFLNQKRQEAAAQDNAPSGGGWDALGLIFR